MDINLTKFDSLDSTSSYLKNYIKDNYSSITSDTLICVVSNTQTKGRGTNGKTWQSPKGNLYLSFGLKINTSISNLRYISLDIGNLIISFFKETYFIGLYQKWPNDIYFNSSKLSGILSESFKIDDNNFLLVGIGININNIDSINISSLKAPPISLSKILNYPIDLEEFRNKFIDYLSKHIENIIPNKLDFRSNDPLSTKYPNFYPSNYPFLSLKDNFIYYIDYSSSYSDLFLKKDPSNVIDDSSSIKVLSTDENIIPLYSRSYPFIGMDVGNSRVKIFLYNTSKDIDPILYKSLDINKLNEEFFPFINELSSNLDTYTNSSIHYHKYPIHTISVSDINYKAILPYLESSIFSLIPTNKKSVYLQPSYPSLGIDRHAIMEACIKLYPNTNIAVLSLGTATTVDIISKNRKHLGGFIISGLKDQLVQLSQCSNLPSLNIDPNLYQLFKDKDPSFLLGSDTNSSIINGVIYNTISLIHNIVSNFLSSSDILVLTGGWSEFIFNLLNSLNKDNKIIPSNISVVYNEYLCSLGTKIMTVNG